MEAGRGDCLTLDQRRSIQIVAGSAYPELARAAARAVTPESYEHSDLDPTVNGRFENSELKPQLLESARGKHVIIIQSAVARPGFSVNDGLIEAGLFAQAANLASASEVTLIAPVFPYARQDRKDDGRVPLSARFAVDVLAGAGGVRRFVAVDVHSPQIQMAHGGPFDFVPALPLMAGALREHIGDASLEDFVIVAPDEGAVNKAGDFAKKLGGVAVTFIPKKRSGGDGSIERLVGVNRDAVQGKRCLVVDDMADSGRTLGTAGDILAEAGAVEIVVAATHGLFSNSGDRLLANSVIDKVIVTNTAPQIESKRVLRDKLQVVDITPALGQAIYEIVTHGSISKMHDY